MSQIFVSPFVRATQGSGAIAGGAFLYFYLSGTTTPATVYADSALTTVLPSPVPANAFGVFPNIFLNPNTIYRVVEKTATGAVLGFDADPVYGQDPSAAVNAAAIVAETERAEGVESDLNVRLTTAEGDIDVLQTNVAAFQGTITSGRRAYGTYASAVSDAATPVIYPAVIAGTVAEVPLTDTGTHTDPVVGGTVNNSGIFRWSVSPAGWRRMYDIDAAAAQTYSTLAGHFANDSTDVQVPGQGDTAARGSQYWSITSSTAATLAGHFANDSTDVQVPGQADTAARGAKYWSIQAAALASGQTIGLVLPSLPVPADIFAEFFDSKYYFQGYTYVVFTNWVSGTTGTFTRGGSNHRYINSSGIMVNASANAARITYDPVTLAPLGLLYEPSATQLFSDSQAINTATWHFVLSAATTTDNYATGIDGTTSAGFLMETAVNNQHYMWYRDPILTITSGLFYAYQIWLKAAGRTKLKITPSTDLGFGAAFTVDLGAGTVSNPAYTLEAWQNGWFRLWRSGTATATAVPNIIYQLLDASGATTYTGDGVSGMYFSGHQLEQVSAAGKPPTSYILRVGTTAAVRSADALQMTLPSTVSKITYTLSDNSQQIISVASGSYTVPTNLNKSTIKSLISVDLSTVGSPVTSVAGRIGDVVLAQADITGLKTTSSPTFVGITTTGVSQVFGGGSVFANDICLFKWSIGAAALTNAARAIIIGNGPAAGVTTWSNSIVIGHDAAHAATNISTSVVSGDTAAGSSPLVTGSEVVGNEAGNGPSISGSQIFGNLARCGGVGSSVVRSCVFGQNGMFYNGSTDTVAIGQNVGLGVAPAGTYAINQSVMIGSQSGKLSGGGTLTGLILIGYNIQAPTPTTSNYISLGDAFIQNTATGATKIQKAGGGRALFSLPGLAASTSYANDAAAAAGGVAVDEFYRNGSAVQVRVV